MTRLLRRLQPDNFEEIICIIGLYRPVSPSVWNGRLMGRAPSTAGKKSSPFILARPVLKPTYGLTDRLPGAGSRNGASAGWVLLGQADLLRRAIGKKKAKEMEAQRGAFVEGCQK